MARFVSIEERGVGGGVLKHWLNTDAIVEFRPYAPSTEFGLSVDFVGGETRRYALRSADERDAVIWDLLATEMDRA